MSIMEQMMGLMMGRMSKEDKEAMMDSMMEKFLADITPEEKQKMMTDMMPRMMEGMDMSEMMPRMMPNCIRMMMPQMDAAKRRDMATAVVKALVESGAEGMSAEERRTYLDELADILKTPA